MNKKNLSLGFLALSLLLVMSGRLCAQEWKDYTNADVRVKFRLPSNWSMTVDTGADGDGEIECESPDGNFSFFIASTDPGFQTEDQILLERLFKELIPQMLNKSGQMVEPNTLAVEAANNNNIKGVNFQAILREGSKERQKVFGVIGFFKERLYTIGFSYPASKDNETVQSFMNRLFDQVSAYSGATTNTRTTTTTNTPPPIRPTAPAIPTPPRPVVRSSPLDVAFSTSKETTLELINQKMSVKQIALSPTGGWLVLYGRNGYKSGDLPSSFLSKLYEINQKNQEVNFVGFAPNGGWVLIYGGSGYVSEGLAEPVRAALYKINQQGQNIDLVAFTPSGGWVVVYGGSGYESSGLSESVRAALYKINQQKQRIDVVAFTPLGGWVVVYGRNGWESDGLSVKSRELLMSINKAGGKVETISFKTDNEAFIIWTRQ
jgi:hypothetical protein